MLLPSPRPWIGTKMVCQLGIDLRTHLFDLLPTYLFETTDRLYLPFQHQS